MPALLVDARNAMYKAVYASLTDRSDRPKYHFFTIFLRQMAAWINQKNPTSIHVFWDAPRETVWRRGVLPTYKDRTKSNYVEGLAEGLAKGTSVAQAVLPFMGVRQYSRDCMEADDLLYAAVSLLHPKKTVIVSNDSDMVQIAYRFNSCTIYSSTEAADVEIPDVNPAHLKALMGDKADSIAGYEQVGPVTARNMLLDQTKLQEFLALRGSKTYRRNLALIDLGMCPKLLSNTFYVQKVLAQPVAFDKAQVNKLIMEYKINGMLQEFMNLVMPYERLV